MVCVSVVELVCLLCFSFLLGGAGGGQTLCKGNYLHKSDAPHNNPHGYSLPVRKQSRRSFRGIFFSGVVLDCAAV